MAKQGTQMAVDPKAAILEALTQRGDLLPIDLLEYLETERNLSDSVTKEAILDLIAERVIEFSPDQKLRQFHGSVEHA